MSVAFTREEDAEAAAAHLPDRPISPHPNLVTLSGLKALEAARTAAKTAYVEAQARGGVDTDRTAMARATRDLRYWSARRASTQLTERDPAVDAVQFGDQVRLTRGDGRQQTFRLVGEDEADPSSGLIAYVSPLARALLGRRAGDAVEFKGEEIEIVGFDDGSGDS